MVSKKIIFQVLMLLASIVFAKFALIAFSMGAEKLSLIYGVLAFSCFVNAGFKIASNFLE